MTQTIIITNEYGVKAQVKKILKRLDVFYFMPAANGFGMTGTTDFIAIVRGQFVGIETKFGTRPMTANQVRFCQQVLAAGGRHYLVTDRNLKDFEKDMADYVAHT